MTLLLSAFAMGPFAAIIPGPLILSGVASILGNDKKGLYNAIQLVLVSAFVEFFIASGIVLFASSLSFPVWFFQILGIIGASLLLWLSWNLWNAQNAKIEAKKIQFSAWQMVAITVFNPMLWSLWITVSMPLALQVGSTIWLGEIWYVVCFLLGIIIGHTALFGVVYKIQQRFLSPEYTGRIFQIVAIGFVLFAALVLWNTFFVLS